MFKILRFTIKYHLMLDNDIHQVERMHLKPGVSKSLILVLSLRSCYQLFTENSQKKKKSHMQGM
jgi:hypothetical protein